MKTRPLLFLTLFLLTVASFLLWHSHRANAPIKKTTPEPVRTVAPALIGGSFALTDTEGHTVKDTDFRGKLMLVFFGFTHCPDICPMTMATYSEIIEQLGARASQIAPIFISVDPERDTPERMEDYLRNFSPGIIGLTGNKDALDATSRAYKVYHSAHHDAGNADYQIDHSGFIYVMDRQGRYLTHFAASESAEAIIAKLQPYLE